MKPTMVLLYQYPLSHWKTCVCVYNNCMNRQATVVVHSSVWTVVITFLYSNASQISWSRYFPNSCLEYIPKGAMSFNCLRKMTNCKLWLQYQRYRVDNTADKVCCSDWVEEVVKLVWYGNNTIKTLQVYMNMFALISGFFFCVCEVIKQTNTETYTTFQPYSSCLWI